MKPSVRIHVDVLEDLIALAKGYTMRGGEFINRECIYHAENILDALREDGNYEED